MTFLLYGKRHKRNGCYEYNRAGEFSLAGYVNGLIYRAIKDKLPKEDYAWTLERDTLLEAAEVDPTTHALVTDLKPSVQTERNIFEIIAVLGYSYNTWTPIMLCLETLFTDYIKPGTAAALKARFDDSESLRTPVHTFLYLNGGYADGDWNFGPIGSVNGALLWPDALGHFVQRFNRHL